MWDVCLRLDKSHTTVQTVIKMKQSSFKAAYFFIKTDVMHLIAENNDSGGCIS